MSTDQITTKNTTDRLSVCWQALREAYRKLDVVTRRTLGTLVKVLIVVYFIFCSLVLALRYVVLPHIDNYKPDIERLASHAIGNKVTVATLKASWDGIRPKLSLHEVAIHDKFGNEALKLPEVSATLSWLSVALGEVRLHHLEIDRPDMDVRRDADGKLYVAGIYIDTGKSSDGKGLDWVLSQHEIVIRDGRLRWNDYKRAAPELMLEDVNFVLRNQWQRHSFALKATPPAAFAAPIDVRATFDHPVFTHRMSDIARWKGELYADLRDTDLTVWKAYFDYPAEVWQGKGSVRAWLNFDHAKIADFTSDLSLSNVSVRLRKDLPMVNLVEVSGRVSVREEFDPHSRDGIPTIGVNGHAISLTDFSLQTDDGLFLPRTTISESFTPAKNGSLEKTEINARLLDLRTLAELAERLPLRATQRQILSSLSPRGTLRDFSAQWQGSYPAISTYNIKGRFEGLSLSAQAPRPARPKTAASPAQAAVPAIPGVENLTGWVNANERGGSFGLASDNLKLQLPGYFSDPVMPFDRLQMQASWGLQERNRLLFEVRKMDFVQEGLSGSFSGKHVMSLNDSPGKPHGNIDIIGRLNGLELQKIGRYLPLQTPESLREWLAGALVGGTAHDVKLKLKGDLAYFPFHGLHPADRNKGEFAVAGRIEDGKLNYAPGLYSKDGISPMWPLMEEINGTISFDRTRMEIHAHSAKTSGVGVSNVKAIIPDLSTHDQQLTVDGEAAGPLQEFLRFTKESPVENWIAQFTEETKASGNAKLALKLQMPLAHVHDTKVKGTLQFAGNTVTLRNIIPPLSAANGKLEFNETGFNLNGVRANFLGGPVAITGGTQRDGNIAVRADGTLTADGVRRAYATSAAQRFSERISGSARYATTIRVRNKHPEIIVESNLAGIGLNFPAPLRKAPNESLPLKFEMIGLSPADSVTMRDEIKLSLGSAIAARYERQKSADKDAQWRVVRGGIGVNVAPPQTESGLIANVNLKSLDIDAWRRALATTVAPATGRQREEQQDALSISQYIEPEMLAARANELILMNKKLDNVVVGASYQKGLWQANIDSDQASGYVTWAEGASGQGLGKVTARLASLVIPKAAASDVSDLLEGKNTATQIPALDIAAENFELFGKKFGHLELVANNARGSAGSEWRINRLSMVNADAEFKAAGKWTSRDGDNITNLNYTLNIVDAGRLLDRFGFANILRGGKGKMEGELNWKGLPFSLDIPSLSGRFNLDIAAGQFLKVDPAAAKLLGVLSLQSLPRRLVLDFHDVFSEGFAFDGMTANASIAQGVAKTDNFKMRGVAAAVLIDGSADIAKETQNLHVVVIPDINVGAASVVYGLAVNPLIGVGTFLAQLFLRDPLAKAFTFEYQVTGPWKDPVVTKLMRKQENTGRRNVVDLGSNG